MNPELIRMLNEGVSMRKVLKVAYGIEPHGSQPFPCPFPEHGSDDSHASARLYDDTNVVYCFAEQRTYTVYDALRAGGKDDYALQHFVVCILGDEQPVKQVKTRLRMRDLDDLTSVYLEGSMAQFRRGEIKWPRLASGVTSFLKQVENGNQEGSKEASNKNQTV